MDVVGTFLTSSVDVQSKELALLASERTSTEIREILKRIFLRDQNDMSVFSGLESFPIVYILWHHE